LPELAGIGLAEAIALVTCNPARAAGLTDRGEITVGKRADLIAVKQLGGLPQADRVWVAGVARLSAHFDHA
jgi:alpha-D-ribose 1-methylphosphonate 5-triphosphate diphosphatase